jgi:ABC-2 type transport system ATP-binding protein
MLKERLVKRRTAAIDFWALRDVSVDVAEGQTVGLIGANGSGKSTLLKVLAGILRPTAGTVEIQGRVASLLELGAGFNGELTGRENVYLNASMLGLSRRETDRLFDDIVDFAELADFIDGPVKHYSSGMYVRLGFAVAVHVDPDVLLVDEVLAVGDEAFASKCLAKIAEFQAQGRTILVVSHSLEMVRSICDRALVLSHGRLIHDGSADDGVQALRAVLSTATSDSGEPQPEAPTVTITTVDVHDATGAPHTEARPGDAVQIRIVLTAQVPQSRVVRVVVTGHFDLPMFVLSTPGPVPLPEGTCEVVFDAPSLPAMEGTFSFAVGIEDAATGAVVSAARFEHRLHIRSGHGHGLLAVPHVSAVHVLEPGCNAGASSLR